MVNGFLWLFKKKRFIFKIVECYIHGEIEIIKFQNFVRKIAIAILDPPPPLLFFQINFFESIPSIV